MTDTPENVTPTAADAAPVPPTAQGGAEATPARSLPSNLELLLDVELEATIRFGERELFLRDIFALMPGSVVELNQMLNEPAELLIAGRRIARGEVVVVDGNFGLRVSEVASRSERAAVFQV
jgi:flagellar motor switch protein FliN